MKEACFSLLLQTVRQTETALSGLLEHRAVWSMVIDTVLLFTVTESMRHGFSTYCWLHNSQLFLFWLLRRLWGEMPTAILQT